MKKVHEQSSAKKRGGKHNTCTTYNNEYCDGYNKQHSTSYYHGDGGYRYYDGDGDYILALNLTTTGTTAADTTTMRQIMCTT